MVGKKGKQIRARPSPLFGQCPKEIDFSYVRSSLISAAKMKIMRGKIKDLETCESKGCLLGEATEQFACWFRIISLCEIILRKRTNANQENLCHLQKVYLQVVDFVLLGSCIGLLVVGLLLRISAGVSFEQDFPEFRPQLSKPCWLVSDDTFFTS